MRSGGVRQSEENKSGVGRNWKAERVRQQMTIALKVERAEGVMQSEMAVTWRGEKAEIVRQGNIQAGVLRARRAVGVRHRVTGTTGAGRGDRRSQPGQKCVDVKECRKQSKRQRRESRASRPGEPSIRHTHRGLEQPQTHIGKGTQKLVVQLSTAG